MGENKEDMIEINLPSLTKQLQEVAIKPPYDKTIKYGVNHFDLTSTNEDYDEE